MISPFDAIRVDLRPEYRYDDRVSEFDGDEEMCHFMTDDFFFDLADVFACDKVLNPHLRDICTKVWFKNGSFVVLRLPYAIITGEIRKLTGAIARENLLTIKQ